MRGILFDARVIRPGMTGIGTYTRHLLRALPPGQARIGIILPEGSPFAAQFPGCTIHFTRVQPDSHPLTELFEQIMVPWICRRHGYTAFVATGGATPAFHPGFKTYPFIHDLAFLRIKGSHNWRYSLLLRFNLWITRTRSDRVLTVSETARSQIISMLGIARRRTAVVYPADSKLDEAPFATPRQEADQPYFLAVSLTNKRKNIPVLLDGFRTFNASVGNRYRLLLTGNADLIGSALVQTPVPGAINLGFVADGELRSLYGHATALIYASLDEGFGIPLVDAARQGCPVVCSDIPVFREVMGPQARYFNPTSPGALADALAVQSADTRAGQDPLPEARRPVALRFSWERSAEALLAIVNEDT